MNHTPPPPAPGPSPGSHLSATTPVLMNFAIDPPEQAAIQAVDPRVRLLLAMEPAPGSPGSGGTPPGWQRREEAALRPLLEQAEVLFSFRFPVEWLDGMPALRWLQLSSAGADHMIEQGLFKRRPDLVVTTASGIHAIPIGEHVIGMILAFARGFPTAIHHQHEGRWVRYTTDEAHGRTLGLIGYGPIGRRIAQITHVLGME